MNADLVILSAAANVKEMPAKALIYVVLRAELCYVCQSGKYKIITAAVGAVMMIGKVVILLCSYRKNI